VTCQPIVELRSRALLGSRQLNASRTSTRCAAVREAVFAPCRAEQNRTERCYTAGAMTSQENVTCVYVVARRRAAILSDCKGSERRDVTVLLNNAMTVARRPLTQLVYLSETVSRFSSVPGVTVKKSVLEVGSTSEVSIGDRHGKCEDVKCVMKSTSQP
jgi:hypothetical protein